VPWQDLFNSAIRIAEEGFEVTELLYSKLLVSREEETCPELKFSRNPNFGLKPPLRLRQSMLPPESLLDQVISSNDPAWDKR